MPSHFRLVSSVSHGRRAPRFSSQPMNDTVDSSHRVPHGVYPSPAAVVSASSLAGTPGDRRSGRRHRSPSSKIRRGLFLRRKMASSVVPSLVAIATVTPKPVVPAPASSADEEDDEECTFSPPADTENGDSAKEDFSEARGDVAPRVVNLLDPPASLARAVCLRCIKHLEAVPGFGCSFPLSHSKCTRCTRLRSKCQAVGSLIPSALGFVCYFLASRSPLPSTQPRVPPPCPRGPIQLDSTIWSGWKGPRACT